MPQKICKLVPERLVALFHEAKSLPSKSSTDGNEYFFIDSNGYPISSIVATRTFQRAAQKAGINKNLKTHIFRHSHISLLAELGIPLAAIMERVGHSDPKTTLEIYTHVTQNMTKQIVDKLQNLSI